MENAPLPLPVEEVQRPASSLASRLMNVFAAPGDVFEDLKTAKPAAGNWLVPVLIVTLATIASFLVILSQPTVQQQIVEMQEKAIDQQVAAGKIKADQAKAFKEQIAALPPWRAKSDKAAPLHRTVCGEPGLSQSVAAAIPRCMSFWMSA